ncbi:MAG: DUF368 domain-containing protein [Clostridia bacterium]|nr:DUF368 domain-containing protein [Clostridia bacterium]
MKKLYQPILWIIQGALVGFGAILPGLSGGALCAAFGLYQPIIEVLSKPLRAIRKYWYMLLFVALGGILGVVGLAGLADWLLELNATVVYCVFAGLVLGTVPELYVDAGQRGRSRASYLSMGICFAVILAILIWLRFGVSFRMPENLLGWMVCGVLWGLSFIVPGLSSSNVIMFIGLYQPMMAGIKDFEWSVLLPMGGMMLATLLLFSQLMKRALDRFYSVVLHGVLGSVLATSIMIVPAFKATFPNILIAAVSIIGGAVASFFFTRLCGKLKRANGVEA